MILNCYTFEFSWNFVDFAHLGETPVGLKE